MNPLNNGGDQAMKVKIYLRDLKTKYTRHVHGPKVWPWWKLIVVKIYKCSGVTQPSTAYNVWIYTKHQARMFMVAFDRRKL